MVFAALIDLGFVVWGIDVRVTSQNLKVFGVNTRKVSIESVLRPKLEPYPLFSELFPRILAIQSPETVTTFHVSLPGEHQ